MTELELSSATFAPLLDQRFLLRIDAARNVEVELIEVTEPGSRVGTPPTGRRAPFSIVFRGPHTPALPQRIYRVEHDGIGPVDLFLVPIGPDEAGMRYEAVFG